LIAPRRSFVFCPARDFNCLHTPPLCLLPPVLNPFFLPARHNLNRGSTFPPSPAPRASLYPLTLWIFGPPSVFFFFFFFFSPPLSFVGVCPTAAPLSPSPLRQKFFYLPFPPQRPVQPFFSVLPHICPYFPPVPAIFFNFHYPTPLPRPRLGSSPYFSFYRPPIPLSFPPCSHFRTEVPPLSVVLVSVSASPPRFPLAVSSLHRPPTPPPTMRSGL